MFHSLDTTLPEKTTCLCAFATDAVPVVVPVLAPVRKRVFALLKSWG